MPNPEREDAVERVVDFLDAWRYCPVSSSANAARECLEKAAHELLDSITVVPKSVLLAAEQRAEEAERERDEAMETPTAALDAVLIERMQIAEAQRDDYKARVEELESALREARDCAKFAHHMNREHEQPECAMHYLAKIGQIGDAALFTPQAKQ